jgi:hypothetical protein
MTPPDWDRLRQGLNLVLALAMPVTTFLAFSTGTSFEEATRTEAGEPPIVPAGYAFIIWAFIYSGSVAYAVFQALPAQQENDLLRRVGPFTAAAFLGTSWWLVLARFGWVWLTVVCIAWILASLAVAFFRIVQAGPTATAAEHYLVVLPVSVFTGWVTVAIFANTSAALRVSGLQDVGLSEGTWTISMLLVAGLIGSTVTVASRGNAGYALAVIWALIAIAVANVTRSNHATIAWLAAGMAALVALALFLAPFTRPRRPLSVPGPSPSQAGASPGGSFVGPRQRG